MTRFFRRITEKALDVTQAPVVIVALGDSVTQGVMEHRLLDAEGIYHRQLQQKLEAFFPTTTFSTINAGVSGGSAPQAVERLERDAIRHQPDLVLVAFGLNDSLGSEAGRPAFEDALRTIAIRIKHETEAAVIFLTPPFMARSRNFRIHADHTAVADRIIQAQTSGDLAAYAQSVRQIAKETDAALADIQAEWVRLADSGLDTDIWLINGLNHPDRRGHTLAAELLFHKILAARGE